MSTQKAPLTIIESFDLPEHPSSDAVYRLLPKNPSEAYYHERTDRNIGWITRQEQDTLRNSVVGVAGCGGMGGLIAATLVRAGVGEVRIADCEVFDVSNINRQYAAGRNSVGKSKVFETARMIRTVSDDTTLVVYPQGISKETVDSFIDGCHLICDEVEFFSIGARVLMHQKARARQTLLLNCDTVGHATFCFKFTHDSMTLEEVLGFDYAEAQRLEDIIRSKDASPEVMQGVRDRIIEVILRAFVPHIPEYGTSDGYSTVRACLERIHTEGRASIIATNPVMASGFMANRILAELVYARSTHARTFQALPAMPGYLAFDAITMQSYVQKGVWW